MGKKIWTKNVFQKVFLFQFFHIFSEAFCFCREVLSKRGVKEKGFSFHEFFFFFSKSVKKVFTNKFFFSKKFPGDFFSFQRLFSKGV